MRVEPGPFLDEKLWKASSKADACFYASVFVHKQRVMHNPGLKNEFMVVACWDVGDVRLVDLPSGVELGEMA